MGQYLGSFLFYWGVGVAPHWFNFLLLSGEADVLGEKAIPMKFTFSFSIVTFFFYGGRQGCHVIFIPEYNIKEIRILEV